MAKKRLIFPRPPGCCWPADNRIFNDDALSRRRHRAGEGEAGLRAWTDDYSNIVPDLEVNCRRAPMPSHLDCRGSRGTRSRLTHRRAIDSRLGSQSGNRSTYCTCSAICAGTGAPLQPHRKQKHVVQGAALGRRPAHGAIRSETAPLRDERVEKHATNASASAIARSMARVQFCPGIRRSLSSQGVQPAARSASQGGRPAPDPPRRRPRTPSAAPRDRTVASGARSGNCQAPRSPRPAPLRATGGRFRESPRFSLTVFHWRSQQFPDPRKFHWRPLPQPVGGCGEPVRPPRFEPRIWIIPSAGRAFLRVLHASYAFSI